MVIIVFLLMFVLFLSTISIVFDLTGSLLLFEQLLNIVLLIFALKLISSLSKNKKDVWPKILIFFTIVLINQIILYRVVGFSRIVLPLTMTMLGFVIAISKSTSEEDFLEEPIVETNEPGKYVASKTGKKFHVPECNQVKRIKEDKKVFFNSEKDAKKEGKTACKCV